MYTVDNIYEGMYKLSYDMLRNTIVLYGVQRVNTCMYYIYEDTTSMCILPYLFNSCIQQVIGHTSRYEEVSRIGGAEAVLNIGFTDAPVG